MSVEFFQYFGGIILDSRCFCIERHQKFYHKKEIEAWGRGENLGKCNTGDGKWAGYQEGTNADTEMFSCFQRKKGKTLKRLLNMNLK